MLITFSELAVFEYAKVPVFGIFLPAKKPGCLGWGRATSLVSIITAEDMVGLSSGCSWTHKRPTWIDRATSDNLHEFLRQESTNSNHLSSLCSIHTCHIISISSGSFCQDAIMITLIQYVRVQEGWGGGLYRKILCFASQLLSLALEHQSYRHLISLKTDHL